MNQEKVNILIPVYNTCKYIRQCLDSIVSQTYGNIRVIIVDDGSTDNSLEICREYASRYDFIEVYRQDNAGVAAARNTLLDKIDGDYALFVDSDDWIEHTMIEDLLNCIHTYNLDIAVCGSVSEHNDSNTPVVRSSNEPLIENRREIIKKFLLHKELNGSLCNKLVKTSLFHKLRFDPEISYGEDALLMWQVLQKANRVGTIETPYYHYRMNNASISHQSFGPKKMSGHKVWKQIYDDTARLWPDYEPIARASFAISDMWLLFYAAKSAYPFDSNIKRFQSNVKANIQLIRKMRLLSVSKLVYAFIAARSYSLARIVTKII